MASDFVYALGFSQKIWGTLMGWETRAPPQKVPSAWNHGVRGHAVFLVVSPSLVPGQMDGDTCAHTHAFAHLQSQTSSPKPYQKPAPPALGVSSSLGALPLHHCLRMTGLHGCTRQT